MPLLTLRRLSLHSLSRISARMSATMPNGAANASHSHSHLHTSIAPSHPLPTHTITALNRWSCADSSAPLPPVSSISSIHIYDFDNTLFSSPLPNRDIWQGPTIGWLSSSDTLINGGWWHDPALLARTGEGVEKEEPRGWNGWWNEDIVKLVQLSSGQKDVLSVLLTGRGEAKFSELIKRIVRSRGLEFDMVCLKPAVGPQGQKLASTMAFKQQLLKEIVYTYAQATDIRIYEDRPHHVRGFREFFTSFNQTMTTRKSVMAEVIHVAEQAMSLDPVAEVAEIQRMINEHNLAVRSGTAPPSSKTPWQIKRNILFTGYLIQPGDSDKLLSLAPNLPNSNSLAPGEIRPMANSILIKPFTCTPSLLKKVGGLGTKVRWRTTGVACYENKLWAARVAPVDPSQKIHTENSTPSVILALRRGARPVDISRIQNWQPLRPDQELIFEATVGEKVLLRVEEERPAGRTGEYNWENAPNGTRGRKRPHPKDEDVIMLDEEPTRFAPSYRDRQSQHNSHAHHSDRRGPPAYRGGNQNRGRGGHAPRGGHRDKRDDRRDDRREDRRDRDRGGPHPYGRGGGGGGGGFRGRGRGGHGFGGHDRNGYGSGYHDLDAGYSGPGTGYRAGDGGIPYDAY